MNRAFAVLLLLLIIVTNWRGHFLARHATSDRLKQCTERSLLAGGAVLRNVPGRSIGGRRGKCAAHMQDTILLTAVPITGSAQSAEK